MSRPAESEYAPYYHKYVSLVPDGNVADVLAAQTGRTSAELRAISEEKSLHRYAPGKWSLRESWLHVCDTERIFAYRLLRIGRGDQTPLPGFDQDPYVPLSGADSRTWASIVEELAAIRESTLHLLRNLPNDAWTRTGTASGNPVSVRAIAYMIAGHELHHLNLMRQHYLQR